MSSRFLFRVLVVCLLCVGLGLCGCSMLGMSSQSKNKVVAHVGDKPITQFQVDAMTEEYTRATNRQDASTDQMKKDILCALIKDEAIVQDAEAHGITVSDDEVDKQVEETKRHFPSEDDFQRALSQEGLTLELYKHHLRMNTITQRLEQQVRAQHEISNDELLQYIKDHNDDLTSRKSSHILFKAGDEQLAHEVLQRIKNGEDFGELAQQYSQCPSKAQSGDLGWDCATQFVTSFQDALDKLDKGQISDLVKTEFGIHIIKCTDLYHPSNPSHLTLDQVPQEIQDVAKKRLTAQRRSAQFYEYTHQLLQTMVQDNKIIIEPEANMSIDDLLNWDVASNPVK